MAEPKTVLAPLPQLNFGNWDARAAIPNPLLGDRFSFSPMTPQLYRRLVNLVKEPPKEPAEKEPRRSDEPILLLQNARAVFWAEVPDCPSLKRLPFPFAALYTPVAGAILKRLFDCLLLFQFVPKPFQRSFWCVGTGTAEKINPDTLQLVERDWDYYDFDIKYSEPAEAAFALDHLKILWNKLSPLCHIGQLKALFTDENKKKRYDAAGAENQRMEIDRVINAVYGPEASLDGNEGLCHGDKPSDEDQAAHEPRHTMISPRSAMNWFISGYWKAYLDELAKSDRKQYQDRSPQRFVRAFQIFVNACRMENPHRFTDLMTCLEAMFCTSSTAITHQLSSRICWFVCPDDVNKRKEVFTRVKDLYELRSRIVHGGKYDAARVDSEVDELESLVRRIFQEILTRDKAYNPFFGKDQNACDQYLNALHLGDS